MKVEEGPREELPRICGTCLFHRSYKGLNGEVVLTMCDIKQRATVLYGFCPAFISAVNLPQHGEMKA